MRRCELTTIYEFNDLFICHTLAFFSPHFLFCLKAPAIDEIRVFSVDVDESVKQAVLLAW
jgi:hypothetical protein